MMDIEKGDRTLQSAVALTAKGKNIGRARSRKTTRKRKGQQAEAERRWPKSKGNE
jgi:hypothetical protein